MKLNKREKTLVIIFGILFIVASYFMFFLKPQISSIKKLRMDIRNYSNEVSLNMLVKENVEKMYKEIDELKAKLQNIRTIYPPFINHEEIVILVRGMAKSSGLSVTGMNLSEIAPVENNEARKPTDAPNDTGTTKPAAGIQNNQITDPEVKNAVGVIGLLDLNDTDKVDESKKNVKIDDGKGYIITARLTATGTNQQVKAFINKIKKSKNKISIKNFLLTRGDNNILSLNLTLDFYGIMDKNVKGQSIISSVYWEPLPPAGKDDLFKPYEGYTGVASKNVSASKELTTQELEKYDFTLRAMIYGDNMSPPTVTVVGRSIVNVDSSVPVIYGDSNGEEKVEIYVQEKDGKLYCKFRTSSEAYPDKQYENLKEFTPKGDDIKLLVFSTPRLFANDNSGIELKITNSSKRKVTITTVNEDKVNPRVKIKTVGDFITTVNE